VSFYDYQPLLLEETEQVVHVVHGRVLPSISDVVLIAVFSPTLMFLVWLSVHRFFRSVTYIVTTQRVLVVESQGIVGEMHLKEILRIKTLRKAMMIQGTSGRLWLSRLPDAWHFETTLEKVRQLPI